MRKLLLAMTILMTMGIIAVSAQDDPVATMCFDNGGFIDTETGNCEVRIALEINANYPVEYADIPFVMEHLDGVFDTEIAAFMDMFAEGGMFPSPGGWALDLGYEETRHSDTIFTVKVNQYMYTGGAHGISFQYAYTYNTETETILTLDDVFVDVDEGLAAVAPLAAAQITETLGEFSDVSWIEDGTAPDNPNNYSSWALTADSIQFYFGPYHVAPYAAGPQTVEIPFADISAVIEPDLLPE